MRHKQASSVGLAFRVTMNNMARDIGPDMLANLDRQLEAGNITQAKYDARRAEILELIRKGRAVEYGKVEKVATVAGAIVVFLFGAWLAIGAAGEQSIVMFVIAIALIALGFGSWRRVTRV